MKTWYVLQNKHGVLVEHSNEAYVDEMKLSGWKLIHTYEKNAEKGENKR